MTTESVEDLEKIRKYAFEICQEFLGDVWSELLISEFQFSVVSGGLSNVLYRCALPGNAVVGNSKTPRQVLLRIYGPMQGNLNAVVTGAATFMLLAEKKLGPKLYGTFPDGRLEEFIPSRTLVREDYRVMYPAIARELAKIHSLSIPIRKVPDFWHVNIRKWLNEVEDESKSNQNAVFEYSNLYTEEIKWMTEEIKKSNSPVVFCHNDLTGGNILFLEDSSEECPKLMLIDFEWGSYNYRGFDLANQFIEWCFDYNTAEYPHFEYNFEKFPSEEEQISYIRAYLEQLVEEGVILPTSTEGEIKVILGEIELFSMASHLLWSLWAFKMSFLSNADFSYRLGHKRIVNLDSRIGIWQNKTECL